MNATEVAKRAAKGETIYMIDYFNDYAICYFPDNNRKVIGKPKGKNKKYICDMTNKYIFESILNSDECTKEEFENY